MSRFGMLNGAPEETLIAKGDKFNLEQCPKTNLEIWDAKVPYLSVVGSLIYARACTRLDIAFVVGVLDKYLSDLAISLAMQYL